MSPSPDVLILGGGVIGLTTAYVLATEGARVALVDKGDFGQESSWAGAGILPAPGDPDRALDDYERLLFVTSALFPPFSEELRQRTGVDNGFVRCGGYWTAGNEEMVESLRRRGVRVEATTPSEPVLRERLGRACYFPDTAQVRNPRHVKALIAACGAAGVELRPGCPVHALERDGRRLRAARADGSRLFAAQFLVAAGAWSDGLLEPLGLPLAIRPVRGQIVLLKTQAPLFRPIIEDGKRYLVPRPDGRVLVGSTEEDVGFDKRTTADAVADLLRFATDLVPALGAATVDRCWAGLRPGNPDGLPFLGGVPGIDNLFVAAGHYRAGIQLSPATAYVMADLLRGRPPRYRLEAFRLDRAGRAAPPTPETPRRSTPS